MSEQRPPPSRPAQEPIGWLLSLSGWLIGLVIGALVLRVVLELVGLYFWWPQEGSRHVFQVMRQERAELVIALQPHPLGNEILVLLEKGTTRVLMANRLLQKPFAAVAYTLVSFMQRLVWLAAMLPLICLCVVIGLTEGLVQRDLRRFGSGLESVFFPPLCHQVRQFQSPPRCGWFIWHSRCFCLRCWFYYLRAYGLG
ncbi:integrating conjugative element membrane protein, PFL_4697 family [Escherichia coli]|uniref:Integrating conjugative element membrane protein, PFL_4697 family n=1 Tax=Escherichia coli TaxID=562 RepID=A0A376TLV8_ECOLX|nr:integrating conjugative element membrane protein, PFL_4697 family [Escherichia coli]